MLKNKVFIIIAAIFLSLIIAYNIKFFSQRREKSNTPPSVEKTPDIIESPLEKKESSLTKEKELLSPLWGRNPFLLPGEEKLGRSFFLASSSENSSAVETRKMQEEKELSLTAILYSKMSSRAIINHEIVQEGDTLSGGKVKVIKIMPEQVTLSREGKTFILPLGAMISRETKTGDKQEK